MPTATARVSLQTDRARKVADLSRLYRLSQLPDKLINFAIALSSLKVGHGMNT